MHTQFWEIWKEFEIQHGNEDTVREMLRVKRSVQATYNTKVNFMSYQMHASSTNQSKVAGELNAADKMAQLEAQAHQLIVEENAQKKLQSNDERISFVRGESRTTIASAIDNPDEIDIENINDDV